MYSWVWGHWSAVYINLSMIQEVLGNSDAQFGPSGQQKFQVEILLGNQVELGLGLRYLFIWQVY